VKASTKPTSKNVLTSFVSLLLCLHFLLSFSLYLWHVLHFTALLPSSPATQLQNRKVGSIRKDLRPQGSQSSADRVYKKSYFIIKISDKNYVNSCKTATGTRLITCFILRDFEVRYSDLDDDVKFEVLTAVSVKMFVSWAVAPCGLVDVHRRSRGA
jgi:hypothetical protein